MKTGKREFLLAVLFVLFFSRFSFADTVTFTTNTVVGTSTVNDGKDIVIATGATVTMDGEHSFNSLTIQNGGGLTHSAYPTAQGPLILHVAGKVTVAFGGKIDVNAKGKTGLTDGKTSGASYGGVGGLGGNPVYGNVTEPVDFGEGGHGTSGAGLGTGGGAVRIDADEVLVNGVLQSNGSDGVTYGCCGAWASGGAGGSLFIRARVLSGTGNIYANGGNGVCAAGSGGGRIAVDYTDKSLFSGNVKASGGSGAKCQTGGAITQWGAMGTVYLENTSTNFRELIIDTPYASLIPAITTLPSGSYTFDQLTVQNGATFQFDDVASITVGKVQVNHAALVNSGSATTVPDLNVSSYSSLTNNGALRITKTLTLGNGASFINNGTLKMDAAAGDFRLESVTYTHNGDLDIGTGKAVLTQGGTWLVKKNPVVINNLVVTGNSTVKPATGVQRIELQVKTLTVEQGSKITTEGYGSAGICNSSLYGSIPGGSHGGFGENALTPPFGNVTEPDEAGEGGTDDRCSYSAPGTGGGVIKVMADSATVNGSLNADGTVGIAAGGYSHVGGGAGGSIFVQAKTFAGTGTVSARGAGGFNAGSGAGGRIAVYYDTKSFSGNLFANSYGTGGSGTIYIKPSSQVHGDLIVSNYGTPAALTILPDAQYTFETITVRDSAQMEIPNGQVLVSSQLLGENNAFLHNEGELQLGNIQFKASLLNDGMIQLGVDELNVPSPGPFTFNTPLVISNLTIRKGGVLTHSAATLTQGFGLNLQVDNLMIEAGGKIDVSNKGYLGGGSGTNTNSSGRTTDGAGGQTYGSTEVWNGGYVPGNGYLKDSTKSGGSYGGLGGGTTANPIYGTARNPLELGSGGAGTWVGTGYWSYGGNGGGRIKIQAGTIVNNGAILANGGNAASGGSGGALLIQTSSLTGAGLIQANGGNAGASGTGGGGGGGRIAFNLTDKGLFGGTISVAGGVGVPNGQKGTIYFQTPEMPQGQVSNGFTPDAANLFGSDKVAALLYENEDKKNITSQASFLNSVQNFTSVGKFYADSTLKSSFLQELAFDETAFTVTNSDLLLSLKTDKRMYKPGETVTLTADVTNKAAEDKTNLPLSIQADGVEIFSTSVSLSAGETQTFQTTLVKQKSFKVEGIFSDVTVDDVVRVEAPSVDITPVVAEQAGRAPFSVGVTLKNTSPHLLSLGLNITGADVLDSLTESTILLSPGESQLFEKDFQMNKDTVFTFSVTGDAQKTVRQKVLFGENARVQIATEDVYPEGLVTLPFTMANSGSLDTTFDAVFQIGTTQVTKSVFLPAQETLQDAVNFTLNSGTYTLNITTPFETKTLTLNVAQLNQIAIQDVVIPEITKDNASIPVSVVLKNEGPSDFLGNLKVDAGFSVAEQDLSLLKGETKTVSLSFPLPTIEGNYDVTATVSQGGEDVTQKTKTFAMPGPEFEIISFTQPLVFMAAGSGTIQVTVKNVGLTPGHAVVHIKALEILDQEQTAWVEKGQTQTLSFNMDVPADFNSGDYAAVAEVQKKQTDIPFHVQGVSLDVASAMDKTAYAVGGTAVLTFHVKNTSPFSPLPLFARVSWNGFDETQDFTVSDQTDVVFNVPIASASTDKLFYGIYQESGRSIHLNSLYVPIKTGAITLTTDKQVYAVGDTVTVAANASEAGNLKAQYFGQSTGVTLAQGETKTFSFVVPPVRAGTFSLFYDFTNAQNSTTSGSLNFDVSGYQVKVTEALLDKATYKPQDTVKLTLRFDSNSTFAGKIQGFVFDPNGNFTQVFETDKNVVSGFNRFDTTFSLNTPYSGLYRFIYGIFVKVPEIFLTSGSEAFEVGGVSVLSLETDKNAYKDNEHVRANYSTFGNLQGILALYVDGQPVFAEQRTFSGIEEFTKDLGTFTPGAHTLKADITSTALSTKEVTFTVKDVTPPNAVTDLQAVLIPGSSGQGAGSSVQLTWTGATDNVGVVRYKILRIENEPVTNANRLFATILTNTLTANTRTYFDKSVEAGKTYYYSVTSYDAAGNESPLSNSPFVIIPLGQVDTTPPLISNVIPPDNTFVNSTKPLISATITDDASGVNTQKVFVKVDEALIPSTYDTLTQKVTATFLESQSLGEAPHTLKITAMDNAGNSASSQTTFTVDVTAPVISITYPLNNSFINTKPFTVTATLTDGGTGIDASTTVLKADGVTEPYTYDANTGTLTYPWPANIIDGIHTVTIDVKDRAGNSGVQATSTFTLDTMPPQITNVSNTPDPISPNNSFGTKDATTITASLNEANPKEWKVTVKGTAGNVVRELPGGTPTISAVWNGTDTTGNYLTDGLYKYVISATDLAGNTSASEEHTVTIDNTNPNASLEILGTQYTQSGNLFISGNTQLTIKGNDPVVNGVAAGIEKTEYAIDQQQTPQTYTAPFTLQEGPHTLRHSATDNAGNIGFTQQTQINVDATPPVTTLSPAPLSFTKIKSFTLTANDPRSNNVASGVRETKYVLDGAPLTTYLSGITVNDGYHTIEYFSIDNVGNIEQHHTVTFTVDTIPPQVTAINDQPDPFSPGASSGVKDTNTISASINDANPDTWQLQLFDAANHPVQNFSGTGSFISQLWNGSLSTGGTAPDGLYSYSILATDKAGNTNKPSSGGTTKILLKDNFDGTTLDTSKWTVNPFPNADAGLSVTQENGQLRISGVGSSTNPGDYVSGVMANVMADATKKLNLSVDVDLSHTQASSTESKSTLALVLLGNFSSNALITFYYTPDQGNYQLLYQTFDGQQGFLGTVPASGTIGLRYDPSVSLMGISFNGEQKAQVPLTIADRALTVLAATAQTGTLTDVRFDNFILTEEGGSVSTGGGSGVQISDTFDDGVIDTNLWDTQSLRSNAQYALEEKEGQLVFSGLTLTNDPPELVITKQALTTTQDFTVSVFMDLTQSEMVQLAPGVVRESVPLAVFGLGNEFKVYGTLLTQQPTKTYRLYAFSQELGFITLGDVQTGAGQFLLKYNAAERAFDIFFNGSKLATLQTTWAQEQIFVVLGADGFAGDKVVARFDNFSVTQGSGGGTVAGQPDGFITVDNTLPASVLTPSTPLFNNQFASINTSYTITANDPIVNSVNSGIEKIEVQKDNGAFVTYASAISLDEGKHALKYKATDNAGNTEQEKAFNVDVDGTAPVTALTPSAPLYNNAYAPLSTTYTLSATDPVSHDVSSGVMKTVYKVDGGAETQYSNAISLTEGGHTIAYFSKDNVLNTEAEKTFTVKVDNTPPVTQVVPSSPLFANKYAPTATTYTFTSTDPQSSGVASGVQKVEYTLDGGVTNVYNGNPITLTEGIHTFVFYATDNVGNVEAQKTFAVHVDNTPPVTSISAGEPKYSTADKLYVAANTPITLSASDPTVANVSSGVASTQYKVDSGNYVNYTGAFTLSEGIHTVTFKSTDNVGNVESEKTQTYHVDATPPTAQIAYNATNCTDNGKTVVSGKTQFTLTGNDPVVLDVSSGVKELRYRINGGAWQTYMSAFTLAAQAQDGDVTLDFLALDNVQNTSAAKSITVVLDTTPPVAQILSPQDKSMINNTIAVMGTVTDAHFTNGSYTVAFGTGQNPSTYTGIITSTTQNTCTAQSASCDPLAYWNTGTLTQNALYTLKLTATDCVQNTASAQLLVKVGIPETVLTFGDEKECEDDDHDKDKDKDKKGKKEHDDEKKCKKLKHPVYFTADSADTLYITQEESVELYTKDGAFVKRLKTEWEDKEPPEIELEHLKGISLDAFSNLVVTVQKEKEDEKHEGKDKEEQKDEHKKKEGVGKISAAGDFILFFGSHGNNGGEFNKPTDVILDAQNNIYVCDTNNNRVQKFTSAGVFLQQWTSVKRMVNNVEETLTFNKPSGIVLDAQGNLIISDTHNDRIVKFSQDGALLRIYDATGQTQAPDAQGDHPLKQPLGLSLDNFGNLYVADQKNHRVQKLDPWGNRLLNFGAKSKGKEHEDDEDNENENHDKKDPGLFNKTGDVVLDSTQKFLFVSDTQNNRLQKVAIVIDAPPQVAKAMPVKNEDKNAIITDPNLLNVLKVIPYPTPTKGKLSFNLEAEGNVTQITLEVYSINGKRVFVEFLPVQPAPAAKGKYKADSPSLDAAIESLPNGVYVYRLQISNGVKTVNKTGKFVVVK